MREPLLLLPLTGRKICLDPGHPSENGRGTRGKKLTEIEAAWRVALKTKALLTARGARVTLTKRRRDEMVTNRKRAEIANALPADLMLRLHCDAASGSGITSYYPDRQGVARDGKRGPDTKVLERVHPMAVRFHRALIQSLGGALSDRGLLPDTRTAIGGKQGALTGSIYSEVPVILVEMCVLTNPRDEAFIASRAGQEKMAKALADAVEAAVKTDAPE